ncbi:C40 family peptidase [Paenibacillus arenilitoris]|uniref:SH3 domain-containing protein n=1 Tax=Paenibacillus arenilitoris TaxID=2772299 RepID=A0A927CH12_9BACL|nr:SH3 domain-containing protein [Paenibacillus arenilitoris]MBD2867943.1 SH3 domain-containing protein [Paenibacillus arenilitoris]
MNYTVKQKIATATLTAALLFSSVSVPAAQAAQSAEVQAGVNMRTSPSTSAKVVRTLKRGEKVTIVEKANAYWYKITDSTGKTGYISTSSKYVEVTGSSTAPSQDPNPDQMQKANAVIKASVSFRKSASTSGTFIRYLKKGEKVVVLSKPNGYWYEVQDASGVRGYVSSSASYITVTGPIAGGGASKPDETVDPALAVEKVIAAGMKYLGTPYEYGSSRSNTATFDCSDFVRQAFLDGVGIKLPADSRSQGAYVKNKGGAKTDWRGLKRGDLIFFMSYKGSKASAYAGVNKGTATITHDGIYLGDGQVLHTYSKESGGVKISSIEGTQWEYRFLFGGSAL